MREIIALCAEEIQQIESEIAEVQVLKKKKTFTEENFSFLSNLLGKISLSKFAFTFSAVSP